MADNVTAQSTDGSGATFAADVIGGVAHGRVKIQTGADGTATDTSESNPVPARLNSGSANLDVTWVDYATALRYPIKRVALGVALSGAGGPVTGGTATNPVRVDPAEVTGQLVKGIDGHDEAIASNPVAVGGLSRASEPATAVQTDDVSYLWCDNYGRLVIGKFLPPAVADGTTRGPLSVTVGDLGDTEIIPSPGADGHKLNITSVTAVNTDPTSTLLTLKGQTVNRISTYMLGNAANNFKVDFDPPWEIPTGRALVVTLGTAANVYMTVHFYVDGPSD